MESNLAADDTKALNLIEMKPSKIEVMQAELWKQKDTSKIEDFKQIEVFSDWTYSTPYKGSVKWLSKERQNIRNMTALELPASEPTANPSGTFRVEVTEDEIPFHLLGPDNPIVHSG